MIATVWHDHDARPKNQQPCSVFYGCCPCTVHCTTSHIVTVPCTVREVGSQPLNTRMITQMTGDLNFKLLFQGASARGSWSPFYLHDGTYALHSHLLVRIRHIGSHFYRFSSRCRDRKSHSYLMYYLSLLVIIRKPAATTTAPTRGLEIGCSRMDSQERPSGLSCSGRDAAVLREKGLPLDELPSFNASSVAVICLPAVFMSWSCEPVVHFMHIIAPPVEFPIQCTSST